MGKLVIAMYRLRPIQLVAWIAEFLKERRMRVRLHGSFSIWVEVISGVPQGSVLGPLLFILFFVNDLPNEMRSRISYTEKPEYI